MPARFESAMFFPQSQEWSLCLFAGKLHATSPLVNEDNRGPARSAQRKVNPMSCPIQRFAAAAAIAAFCAVPAASAQGQSANRTSPNAAPKQVMAEDVFKNVQQLRGIPVSEFWDTMGFI